ncbi:dienelactone hydrolase family protein [Nocardia zapadnayensis]|uniref:dienelactone hydrolase family protein n=1 Tax=Nocardia rhamnosiphila TaxID=426716 RepID=UPI0022470066|nr:dienelactone hydrolase family protein [Nocardia zapadnayensis]MCX0270141.1 dienelactone hydrolase family protein [Nocardia zapadnayensis]
MSGTYDDIALLRRGEPEANGHDQEPTGAATSPKADEHVPITVIEPDGYARGGIILLHEAREFTGSLLEFMRALAGEGWLVVAPNLFHRATASSSGVYGDELFEDFDACFDWLTHRGVFPDCIGVLGFDTAGTATFLVATNRPVGAAVSVGATGISTPITEQAEALVVAAPRLQAPWLGLFGAEAEISADDVDALRDAAATAATASLVVTYPGQLHRADHPGGEDGDDLVDSRTRIFDWFDSHLR